MRRAGARAFASVAVAALMTTTIVWTPAPAAARRAAAQAAQPVTMSVVDVSPNTPQVTSKPQPLTFKLQLVNHTADPMQVTVSAARSDPIGSQSALNSAIARPRPPTPTSVSPLTASAEVRLAGTPGASTIAVIRTTTDVSVHDGVCLCANLIYPIWFIGTYTSSTHNGSVTAQTLLPSFTTAPVKNTVSWVWPIFDRPHRLLQSRIFFDDALARELSVGRLADLLRVIEKLPDTFPITIMTDPELMAEIAQMAQGYQVSTPKGLKDGTGTDAATAWLSSFRTALDQHRQYRLEFTPLGDPAVDSLTRAGMSWTAQLDQRQQELVKQALGGRTPPSSLAWPVGRSLSPDTLDALARQGANTVIVSETALSEGDISPVPNALAPAPTRNTTATLAVTSAPIERLVNKTLNRWGGGLAVLPELVSQLALPIDEQLANSTHNTSRYVVITPARYLDVDPTVAVRTIEATADNPFSTPITVEQAVGDTQIAQVERGTLRNISRGPRLGHKLLAALNQVSTQWPSLSSLFHDPTVGAQLFSGFPAAIQRCESTSLISDPSVAFAMVGRLRQVVRRIQSSVYIVRPSDGTYTLTSKNSQLPITVVNRLNAEVDVELSVNPVSGESGLSAKSTGPAVTIKANSKVQVHVPTHVDRVGLIGVVVKISTPGGLSLGAPIRLSVRSTRLGTIGVVITVLAAILLVVAVVIRQVRRLRRRPPREPAQPMPVAAAAASET